jgi:hypothetical protein
MRAHGVAIPESLEGVAIKQWLAGQDDSATLQAALKACAPEPAREKAPGPAPEELVAGLCDRGLDAPPNLAQLKPWIGQQIDTAAGRDALKGVRVRRPSGRQGARRRLRGRQGGEHREAPQDDVRARPVSSCPRTNPPRKRQAREP